VATLRPVAAVFAVFGVFWGSWAVAAADVERDLDLSHGGFGLLLSVALAGAALTNVLGGIWAERRGTATVLASVLAVWGALLLAGAVMRSTIGLAAVIVIVITVGGLVDVVMNVAASAGLADTPGAFVRFHGIFNCGAAAGAAVTGILLANDASWRWSWCVVGAAAAVVAAVCARSTLPAGEPGDHVDPRAVLARLRRERLILIALAFGVGAMVEGGVELWGVLYLRTDVAPGVAVGATSAVIAYSIAALARIVFGPAVGRRGAARGVALGASAAAGGVVLLATAPYSWLAGLGLVIAAGGVSMCWPLLLAHATAGRARPGTIVGAVSAAGYVGFVAGPTIVGWLAATVGLRAALFVLVAGALFVAAAPTLSRRQP
jgi:MFS family permease